MAEAVADMSAEAAAAKQELAACEREIGQIRSLLRGLGPAGGGTGDDGGSGSGDEPNTLEVYWTKIEHLPEAAAPRLSLQLSSPVEEVSLTALAAGAGTGDDSAAGDGADGAGAAPARPGVATFRGVETGQATLVCAVFDEDIPLGTSPPCDLAPVCRFDVMSAQERYETTLEVPIHATDLGAGGSDDLGSDAICRVALRLAFVPSKKDRKEELYERMNQLSQRKNAAVEKLRQTAVAASRQQMMLAGTGGAGGGAQEVTRTHPKAAVRAGFLNAKPKREPSRLQRLYDAYLGPRSFVRTYLPVAQNYLIFGTFVAVMHFKGQFLALPAPV